MKAKCSVCKIEEELKEEQLKDLVCEVLKNPTPNRVDYTDILSIRRGRTCTEGKRHTFVVHEDFDKQIDQLFTTKADIEKIKLDLDQGEKALNAKKAELEKDRDEIVNKIIELTNKLEETPGNRDRLDNNMKQLGTVFELLTGTTNYDIWRKKEDAQKTGE